MGPRPDDGTTERNWGWNIYAKACYDMNEKTEEFHDFAYGLLPDSNDAEKTLSNLERNNINHFYIIRVHVLKVVLVMRK
jgi:hypothetical protein